MTERVSSGPTVRDHLNVSNKSHLRDSGDPLKERCELDQRGHEDWHITTVATPLSELQVTEICTFSI